MLPKAYCFIDGHLNDRNSDGFGEFSCGHQPIGIFMTSLSSHMAFMAQLVGLKECP